MPKIHPDDVAWFRESRGEFSVQETASFKTSLPVRIVHPSFEADYLLRDKDILVQFHLPKGANPQKAADYWDRFFPKVLSDTALRFYGLERKRDMSARRSILPPNLGAVPIDSWGLELRDQALFSRDPEDETRRFLQKLQENLKLEREKEKALKSPGSTSP